MTFAGTNFPTDSTTQITVYVPSGAPTGVIAIQTSEGAAHSSSTFTVRP